MRLLSEVLRIRSGTSKLPASFAVFLAVVLGAQAFGKVPSQILLEAPRCRIRVGEPLLVKLTYVWAEPFMRPDSNRPVSWVFPYATLHIRREDAQDRHPSYRRDDDALRLEDKQGLVYSRHFIIFGELFDGKWFSFFERPGTYSLVAEGYMKKSDTLSIEVQPPSASEKRALSLLTDPKAYRLLTELEDFTVSGWSEPLAQLKTVADECGDTILGKWCSARVGLEYYERFGHKHWNIETFSAEYHQGKVRDANFENACHYLAQALALPDEFAVRERALYAKVGTEIGGRNYEDALAHTKELAEKYPDGTYGQLAERRIRHISKLQEKQTPVPEEKPQRTRGRGVLGVVVGGIAGAIAAGIVLDVLLRKKPRAK